MSTAPDRRPGPRADLDVKQKILDVAEELFAQHGVGEISMRRVARGAGVAPAAVTYHYPSKPELLAAVVGRRSDRIGPVVHQRLRAVVTMDAPPTTRLLVAAVVEPLVAAVDAAPVEGQRFFKIVSALAQADDPVFHRAMTGPPDIIDAFLDAALRVLPDLDQATRYRLGLAMFGMLHALAGMDLAGYGSALGINGVDPVFTEQLISFVAAGLDPGT